MNKLLCAYLLCGINASLTGKWILVTVRDQSIKLHLIVYVFYSEKYYGVCQLSQCCVLLNNTFLRFMWNQM